MLIENQVEPEYIEIANIIKESRILISKMGTVSYRDKVNEMDYLQF